MISAYKPADRMVLARVHKNLLKNRDAYEFFSHIDKNGEPIWTNDIRKRGGVFFNPAKCYRSGISYNPKLRRYLWCQIIPGEDTRYKGGFGIYEAPIFWRGCFLGQRSALHSFTELKENVCEL